MRAPPVEATLSDSDSESLAVQRTVADMKSYVVALEGDATELAAAGEQARIAAEQLTREGTAVRWVRSVYVPEEDSCLLVFEAPTPEAVDVAGRRAGLTYDRIVEGGRAT
jgi:Nickel responsive protein SCO4226-like